MREKTPTPNQSSPPSLLGKGAGGLGRNADPSPTPPPRGEGLKPAARFGLWFLFVLFLALWTWKLLEPNPVPERVNDEIPNDLKFYVAKSLHAGAYAFLTVLAGFLPVRRAIFWTVVMVLALHAVGTEIGQTYVPNRHGSARDVLIDWVGIAIGLVMLRWWQMRQRVSSSVSG